MLSRGHPPPQEPVDLNDPRVEQFPTERKAILERLWKISDRLPEDITKFEGEAVSPIGGRPTQDRDLPVPSPSMLPQISPSLDSIAEENDEREETLNPLPSTSTLNSVNGSHECKTMNGKENNSEVKKAFAEVKEVRPPTQPANLFDIASPEASRVVPSAVTPLVESTRQLGLADHIITGKSSPNITVQPATPASEFNRQLGHMDTDVSKTTKKANTTPLSTVHPKATSEETAPIVKHVKEPAEVQGTPSEISNPDITVERATPGGSAEDTPLDTAKASAIEPEDGRAKLRSRKAHASPERPITPTSIRSAGKEAEPKNYLKAFFHVMFVDWIGGLIRALCGGRGGYT